MTEPENHKSLRTDFFSLSETFKTSCGELSSCGIKLVNIHRDLSRMQSQIRQEYAKIEAERSRMTENYERVISRICDLLVDLNQKLEERQQAGSRSAKGFRSKLWLRLKRKCGMNKTFRTAKNLSSEETQSLIDYLRTMLLETVKREGVTLTKVEKGQAFDAKTQRIISKRPDDRATPGTVLEVVEPGYMHGSNVVRKAKVVVVEEREE